MGREATAGDGYRVKVESSDPGETWVKEHYEAFESVVDKRKQLIAAQDRVDKLEGDLRFAKNQRTSIANELRSARKKLEGLLPVEGLPGDLARTIEGKDAP